MRKVLVASAALVVALAAAPPVGAVNGDLDGNAHPNVGVMLVLDADGDAFEFCGGVLISSTAFLTNYNCPGAVAFAQSIGGRAVITFEEVMPWPPEGPAFRTVAAGYIHPDANPKNGSSLYGVAVLASPVEGVAPAQLPTLQQLASIKKTQPLTIVGYGSNDRRSATATIAAIDPGTIVLQNNANATGQGGACGDGGSPYFLGTSNVVVAVADGETGRKCSSVSGRSGTIRRRRGPSSTTSSACRDGRADRFTSRASAGTSSPARRTRARRRASNRGLRRASPTWERPPRRRCRGRMDSWCSEA